MLTADMSEFRHSGRFVWEVSGHTTSVREAFRE
jgi:hypothetical protein